MTPIQLLTGFGSLTLTVGLLTFVACKQSTDPVTPTTPGGTTSTTITVGTSVPAVYQKIYGATEIYVEGANIVIKTKGRPDHKSPYYQGTQWESTLYEAYNGTNPRYAAQRAVLTNEINGFDQYAGHPQQQGQYHYHIEPTYLTKAKGKGALLGFLLDGFPVYGPVENGKTITNTDLDKYHGHTSATTDYPNGMYHYHTTAEDPYLNGSGFYG